ncbi:MAG TPA: hypothetical protein VF273_08665 [Pelobium sp.]
MKKHILLLILIICAAPKIWAQQVIDIASFGLKANSNQNAIEFFDKALQKAKNYPSAKIIFPKGIYNFIPNFGKDTTAKTYIAHQLKGFKNLVIDGQGSEFVFHGRTIPFDITESEGITFQNFSIDYKRPMVTQGEFTLVSDTALHLKIDKQQYPFEIINNKVWYLGEGWRSVLAKYDQLFDKKTGNIIAETHDEPVGDFYNHYAKEIAPGIISFKGPFNWTTRPKVTDIVTMYNFIYAANTFQFSKCKDVVLKNITLYHGGSLAVYATATENITVDHFDIIARKSKGRLFANMADGFHLKGCRGAIKIENCEYNGGGDDFVNVHNMYASVIKKFSAQKLLVRSFKGFHFGVGDSIWHISKQTGEKIASNRIKSIKLVDGTDWKGEFEVEFYNDIPSSVKENDLLESAFWLPDVEIRNNRILKRHRGTGVRATTPKKVIIEDNYFNTAGHAILIEGDLDGWLESGAVNNMIIRNNTFDNCLTSGSVNGGRWEWGEAVIDITPSVKPVSENSKAFHHNIIIANNKFLFFDYPILRARSVDNLQFINNTLIRTYIQKPYTVVKANFLLEGCHHVRIEGNKFSKDFLGKNISTTFMNEDDLYIGSGQGLKWTKDGKKYTDKLEW